METALESGAAYKSARRRIRRLRGFYVHLCVFLAVNSALLAIDLLGSPERHWAPWPLAGWGIALLIHGATLAFGGRFLGPEWEARKVRELCARSGAGER